MNTTVAIGGLYETLTSIILPILGVIVTGIAGWLANLLRVKFGLEIEQQHRDALQTALTNAAGLAISKGKDLTAAKTIDLANPHIASAVNYVIAAVPDALKYFGLTPESIGQKIAAKIGVMKTTGA